MNKKKKKKSKAFFLYILIKITNNSKRREGTRAAFYSLYIVAYVIATLKFQTSIEKV